MEPFLLVFAALFSVINPHGTGLVFLSMTKYASTATQTGGTEFVFCHDWIAAHRCTRPEVYGISVPVLRVAGGLIVASSGWKLLNEGTRSGTDATAAEQRVDYSGQAFYPLTLPLTTGPATIALMISLGLSRSAYSDVTENVRFFLASLVATVVMAAIIYVCFAYSDRV